MLKTTLNVSVTIFTFSGQAQVLNVNFISIPQSTVTVLATDWPFFALRSYEAHYLHNTTAQSSFTHISLVSCYSDASVPSLVF